MCREEVQYQESVSARDSNKAMKEEELIHHPFWKEAWQDTWVSDRWLADATIAHRGDSS